MKINEIPFRMKFLITVLALYAVVGFFDFSFFKNALYSTMVMFYKLLPLLLFVFILSVFINKYLKTEMVEKYMEKGEGIFKIFSAIALGVLISGPPYVLYPVLGDLKKRGASDFFLAVMLFNQNVKIPFFPAMIYYFGFGYTVVMSVLIIIFSVINGYFLSFFMNLPVNKEEGSS